MSDRERKTESEREREDGAGAVSTKWWQHGCENERDDEVPQAGAGDKHSVQTGLSRKGM